MQCPECGFIVSALDSECPKCHGKGIDSPAKTPAAQASPQPPLSQPVAVRPAPKSSQGIVPPGEGLNLIFCVIFPPWAVIVAILWLSAVAEGNRRDAQDSLRVLGIAACVWALELLALIGIVVLSH